jgi:MFS transporter, UMF1 family
MDRPKNLLTKLGLERRDVRAWAMYDLANSAFATTIITAIFPVYFTSVAGADLPPGEPTRLLARTTTIALATSAILAPFLGAIADYAPVKKRLLGLFMAVGCIGAGGLALVMRGDWLFAAVCFGAGNVGFTASLTFYDSLLPHIAREEEIDRVSTAGYALGYFGGGVLLALNVRSPRRRAGIATVVCKRRGVVVCFLDTAPQARARTCHTRGPRRQSA